MAEIAELVIRVRVKLSFWDALKIRLAGKNLAFFVQELENIGGDKNASQRDNQGA